MNEEREWTWYVFKLRNNLRIPSKDIFVLKEMIKRVDAKRNLVHTNIIFLY